MRLEEAEGKIKAAEAKIAEKDQRITEVERLLGCMGKVQDIFSVRQQKWQNLQVQSAYRRYYCYCYRYRKRLNSRRSCKNVNSAFVCWS